MTITSLQEVADLLRGNPDFTAEVQGAGLALFSRHSSRTAYLDATRVHIHLLNAGPGGPTAAAREALGLDCYEPPPVPVADGAAGQRVVFVPTQPPSLQDIAAVITACSSALGILASADMHTSGADISRAEQCVLALMERAKKVACAE